MIILPNIFVQIDTVLPSGQTADHCDYCWLYSISKARKETHCCDRETDRFPCKQRGYRFKHNLDIEQDAALLACKRLRARIYARLARMDYLK